MAFDNESELLWNEVLHHLQGLNTVELDGQQLPVATLRTILDSWPTPKLQELYDGRMHGDSLPFIRPYIKALLVEEMMRKLNVLGD
jgi:hypothetical protein